jgi:hypothetical protein
VTTSKAARLNRIIFDVTSRKMTGEQLATVLDQERGGPLTAGERLFERWIIRELVNRQLNGEPWIEPKDMGEGWKDGSQ